MLTIAPRETQPKGKKDSAGNIVSHPGYKHPFHLLAYGPKHTAFNIANGYYETNEYCVAPSCKDYDKKHLTGYTTV